MNHGIYDEEIAKAIAELEAEEAAELKRWKRLPLSYGNDVRKLYPLAMDYCGSAEIAADLLRALHHKSANIALFELRRLDPQNRAAALRLIDCMATPSIIPDAGLTVDPNGKPLLTEEQVDLLLRRKPAVPA